MVKITRQPKYFFETICVIYIFKSSHFSASANFLSISSYKINNVLEYFKRRRHMKMALKWVMSTQTPFLNRQMKIEIATNNKKKNAALQRTCYYSDGGGGDDDAFRWPKMAVINFIHWSERATAA